MRKEDGEMNFYNKGGNYNEKIKRMKRVNDSVEDSRE